ncbi:hypothetical protein [Vibrio sp. WXL210]|uniref:hypothetical protein n=1 Tax=Vibrio sp. WXL210 TaxID=3450709 RepID=UPI003EC85B84
MDIRWIAAIVATGLLAGCPLEDSDSGSSSNGFTNRTLNGTAVKGTLENARVAACQATSDRCRTAILADFLNAPVPGQLGDFATTDENGDYEITISSEYDGHPIFIRTFATSETKVVNCDFSSCEDYEGALEGLELNTVTRMGGSAPVTANANSLTTMAANLFIESVVKADDFPEGEVDEASFYSAMQTTSDSIAQLLDLDLSSGVGTEKFSLFTMDLPSATSEKLSEMEPQVVDGLTIPQSLIEQLSLVNASFGELCAECRDTLHDLSNEIIEIVQDKAAGNDLDTAVLASIQNRLDTAKQEIDTNANTIKEVIEDLSIPSITEDIHAILDGVIYEFPKVVSPGDDNSNDDTPSEGGTGGTGGTGSGGTSGGGTGN